MPKEKVTVSFDMKVMVEDRKGYYAASTDPFFITVFGSNPEEAESRALQAVELLLGRYEKTDEDMTNYLNKRGVKHSMHTERMPQRLSPIIRRSTQEMRLEVAGHV